MSILKLPWVMISRQHCLRHGARPFCACWGKHQRVHTWPRRFTCLGPVPIWGPKSRTASDGVSRFDGLLSGAAFLHCRNFLLELRRLKVAESCESSALPLGCFERAKVTEALLGASRVRKMSLSSRGKWLIYLGAPI